VKSDQAGPPAEISPRDLRGELLRGDETILRHREIHPDVRPPKEEEQGISFHVNVQLPIQDESFAGLRLSTERLPTRRLIDQTLNVTADKANFAMSRAEAAAMEQFTKSTEVKSKTPAEIARAAWINLIKGRAAQFQQSGLAQLVPYEMGGEAITRLSRCAACW